MIRYKCDKCGVEMGANDSRRFIVRFEVFAAAGHVDLDAEATREPRKKIEDVVKELAAADPDEIEDQTYRSFRFDLCDACRRTMIARPLG